MEFKILLISQCAVYQRQTWKHVVSMENFIIGLGELTCMAIFGPFDIDEYNQSIIICEIGLLSSPHSLLICRQKYQCFTWMHIKNHKNKILHIFIVRGPGITSHILHGIFKTRFFYDLI